MARKFETIADAVWYLNEQLRKRGYLREEEEEKLRFSSEGQDADEESAASSATSSVSHEQLANDKRAVNVIHKLLQRVDVLQERLEEQDEHLRRSKRATTRDARLPAVRSSAAAGGNAPRRIAKITRIQYRDKDTRHLEATIRRLQLQTEEQAFQLRQHTESERRDVTWGAAPPSSRDTPAACDTSSGSDGSETLDMLCSNLQHVTETNETLTRDLALALRLISAMNKTIYTRYILRLATDKTQGDEYGRSDGGSDGDNDEYHDHAGDLGCTPSQCSDPVLAELARDWSDIRSQLP